MGQRALIVFFALVAGWLPGGEAAGAGITLTPVVSGLAQPSFITHAGDGTGRLFVGLQEGRVVIVRGAAVDEQPFLDISRKVSCCGERGLLGLAFHPRYRENGLFFVNYTDANGDTVVARFQVGEDPDRADPGSETLLLSIPQPFGNHNGGQLQFGPDGFLYIATGDGGSGGDPGNNAQDTRSLLGKILRVDVDGDSPYGIPADNPFAGPLASGRPEIWALGLRNPWRFSFDRTTGDLYVADVGQNAWEEVNVQTRGEPGGKNYGWRVTEGKHCFNPSSGCFPGRFVLPAFEYGHNEGCAVTGGYVYRGKRNSPLTGIYFFGDYCSGWIRGAERVGHNSWVVRELARTDLAITTFGEDEDGELFVADYRPTNGVIYRIGAPLVISPPTGRYVDGQFLEPTLIIDLRGEGILGATASFDGEDVLAALAGCLERVELDRGGDALRCPGLRGADLGPGVHRFAVTLELADGTRVEDGVTWEILASRPQSP